MDAIVAEGKGEIEAFAQSRMRSLAANAIAEHAGELLQNVPEISSLETKEDI